MIKQQPINANTAPKNQVAESRRLLKELNDKAERAADDQTAQSTPMKPAR